MDAPEHLIRGVVAEHRRRLQSSASRPWAPPSSLSPQATTPKGSRSKATFAMLCKTSPIPASSGKTSGCIHLNRGADRRANKALHTVAARRMRYDPKDKRLR